jgi:hypothetical protein
MASFPVVAGAFSYTFTVDLVFFTVMLACLSAYLAQRFRFGFLFAAVPLLFSIAIYQAYIGFFAGILVILLVKDILNGQEFKFVALKLVKYISTLLISLISYLVSLKAPPVADILTGYAGLDELGGLSVQNFAERFIDSYRNVFDIFVMNKYGIHQDYSKTGEMFQTFLIIASLSTLVLLVCVVLNRKTYRKKAAFALMVVLLVLLPPAFNIISIISPGHLYLLMQYSLVLVFVFMLVLIDEANFSIKGFVLGIRSQIVHFGTWIVLVFCFVSVINYAIYSNIYYLKMEILIEQSRAFSTGLMTRIQSEEAYSTDKGIVFYGVPRTNGVVKEFENMRGLPGGAITQAYSYPVYLLKYIGFEHQFYMYQSKYYPVEVAEDPGFIALINNMPTYPLSGGIAEYEDFIVVKFSDIE